MKKLPVGLQILISASCFCLAVVLTIVGTESLDKAVFKMNGVGLVETQKESKHEHEWYRSSITPATCTSPEIDIYSCKTCSDTKKVTNGKALGHSISNTTIIKQATCTEDGEVSGSCSRCGFSVTETIPKKGHHEVYTTTQNPTCTTDGAAVDVRCDVCNAKLADSKVLPAYGHERSNVVTYKSSSGVERDYYHCYCCAGDYYDLIRVDYKKDFVYSHLLSDYGSKGETYAAAYEDIYLSLWNYAKSDSCEERVCLSDVTGISSREMLGIFSMFHYAHPEFYFVSPAHYVPYQDEGMRWYLDINDEFRSATSRYQFETKLSKYVNSIHNFISEEMVTASGGNAEWAGKRIHDQLCYDSRYDYDNKDNKDAYYYTQTIVGIVSYGKTVCAGYTQLFQYLCYAYDLPCMSATGYSENGNMDSAHAWNYFKINGSWKGVDVTWDDSHPNNGDGTYLHLGSWVITDTRAGSDYWGVSLSSFHNNHILGTSDFSKYCNGEFPNSRMDPKFDF